MGEQRGERSSCWSAGSVARTGSAATSPSTYAPTSRSAGSRRDRLRDAARALTLDEHALARPATARDVPRRRLTGPAAERCAGTELRVTVPTRRAARRPRGVLRPPAVGLEVVDLHGDRTRRVDRGAAPAGPGRARTSGSPTSARSWCRSSPRSSRRSTWLRPRRGQTAAGLLDPDEATVAAPDEARS